MCESQKPTMAATSPIERLVVLRIYAECSIAILERYLMGD